MTRVSTESRRPIVIGHRGAAAYAPENTLPSFERALRQGADCVELDLHPTRDGVLVCIHDAFLDRTTDVRERFPDRGRLADEDGTPRQHWAVHDFTAAELRMLDAGSWFAPEFRDVRIATFSDVLDWATGRTTVLAELKDPERYGEIGIDVLALFDATVRRHDAAALVRVQSFDEGTVRRAGDLYRGRLAVTLLLEAPDAIACVEGRHRFAEVATFATGVGPEKSSLIDRPNFVSLAHAAGLRVTPWTFRASAPAGFETVRAEMEYYASDLEVDGLITDNPDEAAGLPREV
jgi:glycerophosphoryl diester phosphodiesterase